VNTHADDAPALSAARLAVTQSTTRADLQNRSSARHFLHILPAAAVVIPLLAFLGAAWVNWGSIWRDAQVEADRTASSAALYVARSLEGTIVAAGRMNDILRGRTDEAIRADEQNVMREVGQVLSALPLAEVAWIVDWRGFPLIATDRFPAPSGISLADRDYFLALREPSSRGTFISDTFVGRFDQRLFFTLAVPRRGSGNAASLENGFDGVIAISIDPILVGENLATLRRYPDDQLSLAAASGREVSNAAAPPSVPGQLLLRRAELGAWVPNERPNGVVSIRPVDGFDLMVMATRPRKTIVAQWLGFVGSHLLFGIPASLALCLLALRIGRDQRRLDGLNAELGRDVQLAADRLDRALRFGLVGTFDYDLRSGISRRSAEYLAIHGLDPKSAAESHADWLRRLHPDDRVESEKRLLACLADPTVRQYGQNYRTYDADGTVRWIAARGEIDRDALGQPVVLRGAHVDVTPLRTAEFALAESDAKLRLAQEALEIGTFEWIPAQSVLNWSAKLIGLWGFDPAAGSPRQVDAMARVHPDDRRKVLRASANLRSKGRMRTEFRIIRPQADAAPEVVWLAARARRLRNEGGRGGVTMGVAYDITERKRAERKAVLLSHEVEHRAKNALALVSSMLRVTPFETAESFVKAIEGRVAALSRALTLIGRRNWTGATLQEILEGELAPFAEAGDGRVSLEGPRILLPPEVAQPMTMAVHELVTNAAKYGALSVGSGCIDVRWFIQGDRVSLSWRETGGPMVAGPPARSGFGSLLIHSALENQVGGQFIRRWETQGLVCELNFALQSAPGQLSSKWAPEREL